MMFYEDFFIDILYGGQVQWCWSKMFKEWSLRLLYYKVKLLKQLKAQVKQVKVLFYSSGFVSFVRGLHFRFCKRWRNYNAT